MEYAAGRWDEVVVTTDRFFAEMTAPGRTGAWYRILRGRIALGRGQVGRALTDAQAALELIDGSDVRYRQAALALQGRCLLASHRRAEAVTCLEELLAEQRERPAQATATVDEAALVVDLGYPADEVPEGLCPTRWHQAAHSLVSRDYHRATQVLTGIRSQVDAAHARLRLAHELAAACQHADAITALDEATAVFRSAGMTVDLDAAEALRRGLAPAD